MHAIPYFSLTLEPNYIVVHLLVNLVIEFLKEKNYNLSICIFL